MPCLTATFPPLSLTHSLCLSHCVCLFNEDSHQMLDIKSWQLNGFRLPCDAAKSTKIPLEVANGQGLAVAQIRVWHAHFTFQLQHATSSCTAHSFSPLSFSHSLVIYLGIATKTSFSQTRTNCCQLANHSSRKILGKRLHYVYIYNALRVTRLQ